MPTLLLFIPRLTQRRDFSFGYLDQTNAYSLHPTPYSLLPTPYSLLPIWFIFTVDLLVTVRAIPS
ncbi:hypothetical protein [Moorena sp. SIO3H5]|uniref:hypothetical protein n=1 Tax=Moorena sp. SIO3H5 TaxID=2607834 RepID=UPI0013B78C85|nr:hypothetical protein [Moorena sp. SIO3H5]NEO68899.1 hypothetical protein [Moorena sp. SIO3H5]